MTDFVFSKEQAAVQFHNLIFFNVVLMAFYFCIILFEGVSSNTFLQI